jgi:hypothetical protein
MDASVPVPYEGNEKKKREEKKKKEEEKKKISQEPHTPSKHYCHPFMNALHTTAATAHAAHHRVLLDHYALLLDRGVRVPIRRRLTPAQVDKG